MKFKGFGDDGGVRGNPKSGGFGSASDSGMSDSGSEHELNEHEKRLINLKQLANNLMTIMTPGSEALSSILAVRISQYTFKTSLKLLFYWKYNKNKS